MLDRAKARDRSFDGQFLTGVLSTGIYCLPSCPARSPNDENVQHFFAPTQARAAGLRACRRCRPDDFYRGYDPDLERLCEVVATVRRSPGDISGGADLAARVGVGFTKLTELFREHYHCTPAVFLATARIDAACRQLVTSRRRVLNVGLDVGFDSSSAFHDNFRRQTGMAPGDYRGLLCRRQFELVLPRGYRQQDVLAYLGRDPDSVCERVDGATIQKACRHGQTRFVLELAITGDRVGCRIAAVGGGRPPEDLGVAAHAIAVRLLNLGADPKAFERHLGKLGHAELLRGRRGARMTLAGDLFECVVWAIVGQQVNLAFAYALRRRLVELCGPRVGALIAHPTAADVAALAHDELKSLQFSRRKAEYLIDTARLISTGGLDLERLAALSVGKISERLLAIRGFGPWTVQYILMRGFGFADCVPVGDAGLTAALQRSFDLDERPDAEQTQVLMAPFSPWRTFAAYHLWQSLGDHT